MPIVEAVGVAVGYESAAWDPRKQDVRTRMQQAVVAAQEEGITDPDVIRARALAARDLLPT